MFGARDAIRSNYVAEVDEAKCVACGQCVETCPGNALKLGQKLCSTEDLTPQPDYVKLSETIHPKRSWNPDYREDHEDVMPTGTAPCKTACPAHVPVQGYLKLAAQGRYTDALELIKKENPFPAVCGRICNKRCEDACTRGSIDDPIAIDDIKKFIAEKEQEYRDKFSNPYNAARYGYIDDVIEPRNTRFRIIRALQSLATKRLQNPAKKHSNIPL